MKKSQLIEMLLNIEGDQDVMVVNIEGDDYAKVGNAYLSFEGQIIIEQ